MPSQGASSKDYGINQIIFDLIGLGAEGFIGGSIPPGEFLLVCSWSNRTK